MKESRYITVDEGEQETEQVNEGKQGMKEHGNERAGK
jgi:hypothetical protein